MLYANPQQDQKSTCDLNKAIKMVTSNPNEAGTKNFHKSVVPPGTKIISFAKTPAQQTTERKTICWQLHACIYFDHALKQYTKTNYLCIHTQYSDRKRRVTRY